LIDTTYLLQILFMRIQEDCSISLTPIN